jgi:hypothetical protein
MTSRARIPVALALAAALALVPASLARADAAFDEVAAAFAQAGGQLDACAFTQAELQTAIRGIPPQLRDVVPDLRSAMVDGVAAHERGDCRGRQTGGATPPSTVATPPVTTTPTTPAPPAGAPSTVTTPAPATTAPGAATTATPPAAGADDRDLTPLLVALVAAGALLLLALLLAGWAHMRGWDPAWVARTRHAWGEAGFRTTSTWSEFTDWLRLGR